MAPYWATARFNPLGLSPQEVEMTVSVLSMSMSLDGYIAGPSDEPSNPGGDGLLRLDEWYGEDFHPHGAARQVVDEENAYGAIVAGRRTVEQVDHWGGDR